MLIHYTNVHAHGGKMSEIRTCYLTRESFGLRKAVYVLNQLVTVLCGTMFVLNALYFLQ